MNEDNALPPRPTKRECLDDAIAADRGRIEARIGRPISESEAQDIQRAYTCGGDPYDMARELEDYGCWRRGSYLMDIMGSFRAAVHTAHKDAMKRWATANREQLREPELGELVETDKIWTRGSLSELHSYVGKITSVNHDEAYATVCISSLGHVEEGLGTHGRILGWEQLQPADLTVTDDNELSFIMAWEGGEWADDDPRTLALFQRLVNTGKAWELQGTYGRTATAYLEAGLIQPAPTVYTRDASGFSSPGTSGGKYHWPRQPGDRHTEAACSDTIFLDTKHGAAIARKAPKGARCKRNGCRQKWATLEP